MTEWGMFGHKHFMLSVDRCFMKFFKELNCEYTNSWCLVALFIPQFIISCNQEKLSVSLSLFNRNNRISVWNISPYRWTKARRLILLSKYDKPEGSGYSFRTAWSPWSSIAWFQAAAISEKKIWCNISSVTCVACDFKACDTTTFISPCCQ